MTANRKRAGGPSGDCICLKCGERVRHQAGTPCMTVKCPKCGATMVREGSEHHELAIEKRKKV